MKKCKLISLFLLRISLGWMFFYAGITKVLDPEWSAAGFLAHAKTFSGFYLWISESSFLPVINFLNEWGLLLIGLSLLSGTLVRLSSFFGAFLMILYYFPALDFPLVGEHSYIVDEHIIYAFALISLGLLGAGKIYGLDKKICEKIQDKCKWVC